MKKIIILCTFFILTTFFVFAEESYKCEQLWVNFTLLKDNNCSIDDQLRSAIFMSNRNYIQDNSKNPENYRVWDNITRKEVMKIISNVAQLRTKSTCNSFYIDVIDDWWCKYIESALDAWYIVKTETFRPNDNITSAEVLKLVFKARKIEKKYSTNNWQKDYVDTAFDLWLITSKQFDYNSNAKRWWIFYVISKSFPEFDSKEILVP